MFHVWWPATAILTILIIFVIYIILIYGDRICFRVKTQTETIMTRIPRQAPSQKAVIEEPSSYHLRPQQQQIRPPRPPQSLPIQQQRERRYEQYEEREIGGGMELQQPQQQEVPRVSYSREVEV
jgi:hypothetical protein